MFLFFYYFYFYFLFYFYFYFLYFLGFNYLCNFFGDEILKLLYPILFGEYLNNNDWKKKECGILALGASAEGCIRGMLPKLPELFESLIKELNNQQVKFLFFVFFIFIFIFFIFIFYFLFFNFFIFYYFLLFFLF